MMITVCVIGAVTQNVFRRYVTRPTKFLDTGRVLAIGVVNPQSY